MKTLEERIEAVTDLRISIFQPADQHDPEIRRMLRDAITVILRAGFPELFAGTHWLAPMEATAEMNSAGWNVGPDQPDPSDMYAVMRDVYLKDAG